MINSFTFWASGRVAPQGSKEHGSAGQLLEVSKYLPSWRLALKKGVYERYKELGIVPADLPLFRGPVGFSATYHMLDDQPLDGPPDLDKILRGTWDVFGKGTEKAPGARLIEDDGRFVVIREVREVRAINGNSGALITVWQENLEGQ